MLLVAKVAIGQAPSEAIAPTPARLLADEAPVHTTLAFGRGNGNTRYIGYFYSHTKPDQESSPTTSSDMRLIFNLIRNLENGYRWFHVKPMLQKLIRNLRQKLVDVARKDAADNRTENPLGFFLKEYRDRFTFESASDNTSTAVAYEDTKWVKFH